MTGMKQTGRRWWVGGTAVGLLALLILTAVPLAYAHTRVEIGPYAVVVGWLLEPPIVGERNALIVEITEDEQPVTGVEATLDVELVYGPETFRANLNPTDTPGQYTVDIFPTVPGQYAVRLFGAIEDTAVDEVIEPEEVFPGSRVQFPEPLPDTRQMEKEIMALEADMQSAQTITYVAVGLAGIALLIAIVSLIKKR